METTNYIPIYRKRCPHCNKVFEYRRENICSYEAPPEQVCDGYEIYFRKYIYCQSCSKEIVLSERNVKYITGQEDRPPMTVEVVDCDFSPINHLTLNS